jgi:transcriptional antiterminator RfaH
MTWYLIQTKPRQELIAEKNLKNQGYECYLPFMHREKVIQKKIQVQVTPLFPRYLFVNLDHDFSSKSWTPIRSTKGVSNLVKFGLNLASATDELIEVMKSREFDGATNIEPLFTKGQSLKVLRGPFAGFESVYQGMDEQMRVIVLFEFMKKTARVFLHIDEVSHSA